MSKVKKGYYMGIDIGTNETKGVLINTLCEVVAYTSRTHTMEHPQPHYFEMDANLWWEELCSISNELIQISAVDKELIITLATSAMGCDCIAVDENCVPLRKAILYGIDARAHDEIEYLNQYYGDQAIHLFHHEICSSDISPKILWIKNNCKDIYDKTYKFLTASSYITAKLTGKYVIDQYLAEDFAPIYNMDQNEVNREACQLFCQPNQVAEVITAMNVAGNMTPNAAQACGLSTHTKVLCGSGDSGAEAISTGVFNPGDLMIQLGSSCYFVYLCDKFIKDTPLWPSTFVIPNTYALLAGTNTAGTLTKWYRDQLYFDQLNQDNMNPYTYMAEDIEKIPAGSDGLITLPYFAGERTPINDPDAKGMIFGFKLSHTRSHLYKSALEGIAYSIAQHIDILKQNDLSINKIMLVGGGTKNHEWMSIIADVLQMEVCTSKVSFGAAYGDALMASIEDGAFKDWNALKEVVKADNIIQPNKENASIYKKYRLIYDKLYRMNRELMHEVSE